MTTGTNPMTIEIRALKMSRDRMSRPFRSVPSRKRGSKFWPQKGSAIAGPLRAPATPQPLWSPT
jgi:hypothetical protein